jgi:hypothetical protein
MDINSEVTPSPRPLMANFDAESFHSIESATKTPFSNNENIDSTTTPNDMNTSDSIPADLNYKNELRFRDNLYRLMISQLFYDGYQHVAVGLSGIVQVYY